MAYNLIDLPYVIHMVFHLICAIELGHYQDFTTITTAYSFTKNESLGIMFENMILIFEKAVSDETVLEVQTNAMEAFYGG